MQDKYAGDIGDYGKFILLNQVLQAAGNNSKLGINWYRIVHQELNNNDGRHIDYLKPGPQEQDFSCCSPVI